MATASSARRVCRAPRSASEYTATVRTSISRQARITRHAISPRLAISTFVILRAGMLGLLSSRFGGCSVSRGTARAARLGAGLDAVRRAHEDVHRADVAKL